MSNISISSVDGYLSRWSNSSSDNTADMPGDSLA
ncbi:hypothetical protein F441_17944, partial [Phytophthora nicotianae CJ01A1]